MKEDQTLFAFGEEEDGWLLVQEKDSGKVGYIPGNYVEVTPFIPSPHLSTDCN
jgi:actin cytoskeleton-regulatory complex protein SLA1